MTKREKAVVRAAMRLYKAHPALFAYPINTMVGLFVTDAESVGLAKACAAYKAALSKSRGRR